MPSAKASQTTDEQHADSAVGSPTTEVSLNKEPGGSKPAAGQRRFPIGELLFALGIVALGVLGIVESGSITVPRASDGLGRVMPYAVSGGLVLIGVLLVVQVQRGKLGNPEDGEDVDAGASTSWWVVAAIVAVVIVHALLIPEAGWMVAIIVLFFGIAVLLGARPVWRAALVAIAIGVAMQVLFGRLLGVGLPLGWFEGLAGILRG